MHARKIAAVALALLWAVAAQAAKPGSTPPEDRAALIGTPAQVVIEPGDTTLIGRRATRQLMATASYPGGLVRDLTRALDWVSLNPEIATVTPKGHVVPKANGVAVIVARGGSVEAKATVTVSEMEKPAPGELPQRRHSGLQPGELQHGRLPRHADGEGWFQAQLAWISAGPGLQHADPRSHGAADQL